MDKRILFTGIMIVFAGNLIAQESPWNNPATIQRIESNIEKYRKGNAVVTVLDKKGKPVANATVVVQQNKHEFLFGCNLFALHQLATPELNRKYEKAFAKLFNFATIPFYWEGIEPLQDSFRFKEGSAPIWRRPPPDEQVKWCKEHDIVIKGHPLMYIKSKFLPKWLPNRDSARLQLLGARHMTRISKRYGNDVTVFDVVNEEVARLKNPAVWHQAPEDYLAWAFQKADSIFPKNTVLLINDETKTSHDSTEEYIKIVKELQQRRIRVDGIGIQFHIHDTQASLSGDLFPPAQLHKAYEQLIALGLPLWITEITIPGRGGNGAEWQGKAAANYYKLWFSEPQMKGITWWNLGDGTAYGEENKSLGGLLDSNMDPKPAYLALDRLINHEWKTNDTLTTDANGKIRFRGFYGQYTIRVSKGKKLLKKQAFELRGNRELNETSVQL